MLGKLKDLAMIVLNKTTPDTQEAYAKLVAVKIKACLAKSFNEQIKMEKLFTFGSLVFCLSPKLRFGLES
jgi:hypothetical protein